MVLLKLWSAKEVIYTTAACPLTNPVELHLEIEFAQSKINVPVKKLDTAISDLGFEIQKPLLIKLDVQGYERKVISGGDNIFKSADAVIMEIMLKTRYLGQASFMELCSIMNEHGLSYAGNLHQVYSNDGDLLYIDAVFIRNK